jgi:hypothetical protein
VVECVGFEAGGWGRLKPAGKLKLAPPGNLFCGWVSCSAVEDFGSVRVELRDWDDPEFGGAHAI